MTPAIIPPNTPICRVWMPSIEVMAPSLTVSETTPSTIEPSRVSIVLMVVSMTR